MTEDMKEIIKRYSSQFDNTCEILPIILAAGHGKRIKSETSKMLHTIWGKPSVERVSQAVKKGLETDNQIIVVGNKAKEVIQKVGETQNTVFAFQEDQKGTGHAVQIALEQLPDSILKQLEVIFVLPGDMGLITAETVRKIKDDFFNAHYDMVIMTGTYEGNPEDNYYGRVIRVPSINSAGKQSPDTGEVIQIMEFKDILNVDTNGYTVIHRDHRYHFTREQLLEIPEFNTGVYAFKAQPLISNINAIKSDNVQGEIYLTDLVSILNKNGYKIGISKARANDETLGFNVKSVLKEMEAIARKRVYNALKDIITINDYDDFFIADDLVERILELDSRSEAVDIVIGPGVHLGKDVHISRGVVIDKNTKIEGKVYINANTYIGSNCSMDNYEKQQITIGVNCQLLSGTVVRGNVSIGDNVRIESGVRLTGSDQYPTTIENNVLLKGTTYIFGSYVEQGVEIEQSILKQKRVERLIKKDGSVQAIRYCRPLPEGLDSLRDL
ncbi:MAG: NTP transferase domain-containing protein [Candidatus Auribacterota bacterium]|nr:NTP transferase domain-containing protein [Candidatus Auribacterota bacterium]